MTLLSSTQTSWLLYPPAYTVPGFSPGFFTPAFRPGLFRLFFAQSLAQSNLSGTEIVVMAMAAIAAIAVTQMIILFITASTFCILLFFPALSQRFFRTSAQAFQRVPRGGL